MKSALLLITCLLATPSALAASPSRKKAPPRPAPCQSQAPQRTSWPQGTLLWGTARQSAKDEMSSVLASLDLSRVQLGDTPLKDVQLQDGRLVAPFLGAQGLAGARLQGASSDGQPVEVALCATESVAEDPARLWYRIEIWNAKSASWENPCIATHRVPAPRALAVQGIWDGSGARSDLAGKFTFACENGAIAKCIGWGYKPWAHKDGRSVRELHQACTRMARADYCGNGRSHTREDSPIDMYDGLAMQARTRETTSAWDPARGSFEAAWTPEGAACLARTRDGRALETILAECPDRFEERAQDLGEGDRCTLMRKGARMEEALLRNRSY